MLERQQEDVFLYEKIMSGTTFANDSKEVTWKLKKKILRFPTDLANVTFVNYLFSPNFKYYLDFNKKKKVFVIKETFTQADYCEISNGLMNVKDDKDIVLVGKKFQWISNNTFRVINNYGTEKTVKIEPIDKFKGKCTQISHCSVPMLNIKYLSKID